MHAAAPDLSIDALLREAGEREGGSAWEHGGVEPALELFVRSCVECAGLTERGQRVLRSIVLRHLRNRVLIEASARAHPAAAGGAGPRGAIVVTGLPRTGTTVVHHLLALGTGARPLRLWEALRPVPPGDEEERQVRIATAATWLERFTEAVPGFRRIHAISGPEGPEECDALLQNSFASQHFDDMFDAPAYSAWLQTADLVPAYRDYALQLRLLASTDPPGLSWVLKSPSHLGHLDALAAALPDAVVVHCHRPPAGAVSSYASLVATLRRAYSESVSAERVGEQALARCTVALARAVAVRDAGSLRTVVDVSHGDIVRDAVGAVRRIREAAGRPVEADEEARMREWVARNPRGHAGAHDHRLADFGLAEDRVEAAFAPYVDRFGDLATS